MMRRVILLLVLALSVGACTKQSADEGEPTGPNKRLPVATISVGTQKVVVELAQTDRTREIGLMFRKHLADGKGMLFIFERDQQLGFWMKNTLIPLSIAYISSDGVIKDIRDMEAQSLATVSSSGSVRYALEVPLGYFQRIGVKEGDQIRDLPPAN